MKLITRRAVLVEDLGQTYLAEPDTDGEECADCGGCGSHRPAERQLPGVRANWQARP